MPQEYNIVLITNNVSVLQPACSGWTPARAACRPRPGTRCTARMSGARRLSTSAGEEGDDDDDDDDYEDEEEDEMMMIT